MSDAEHSPIDFDLRNIFEPDDSPIGISFQNDVSVLDRVFVDADAEHNPRGRGRLPRIDRAARLQRSHHIFFGEGVGTQTVVIQPNPDRMAEIPRSPILRPSAIYELVGSAPSGPKEEETNCGNSHADHEVADFEAEVWPSHHGCFHAP
jgi:hypothetical protein